MTSTVVGTDFTSGAKLPNYVNGRRLTAEDLATSQSTLRARDGLIGRAAGTGVVEGFWVTGTATTLSVAPGLAISPSGQPVKLAAAKTLPLTSVIAGSDAPGAGFSCCGGTGDSSGSAVGAGPYLLTVRPACELQGQAPLAEAPDSSTSAGCGAQWKVDGLKFTAIALPDLTTVGGQSVTAATRRNLIAQWCYGVDKLPKLGADPFGFALGYDGLDTLDTSDFTDCDVPLAVFSWDGQQLSDLDNWSVRRRITAADPVTASWGAVTAERRTSDGQARFLQFQDQLAGLIAQGSQPTMYAGDTFGFLPPVGFLPVSGSTLGDFVAGLVEADAPAEPAPVENVQVEGTQKDTGQQDAAHQEIAPEPTFALDAKLAILNALTLGDEDKLRILQTSVAATTQAGFEPAEFFGTVGRFGGIITWEEAELALQQSWHRDPVQVPTDSVMFYAASDRMYTDYGAQSGNNEQAQTALTYYYVLENLIQLSNTSSPSNELRARLFWHRRTYQAEPSYYVVFIKNYLVIERTRPPAILLGGQGVHTSFGQ